MIEISIVSPVYKAKYIVNQLVEEIIRNCNILNINYEIILVDDGSNDGTWETIKNLIDNNKEVKGIKFSRNFGQHKAISAGLKFTKGKYIVVMDCDLQDDPKEIINLYKKIKKGYKVVRASRTNRQDSFLKKLSSKLFYKLFQYLTGIKQDASIANFGIYHNSVINEVNKMNDRNPYFPSQINWVGFYKTTIPVKHSKSAYKKSTYTLRKLLDLAFNNILSFSDKPLRLTIYLGFLISITSFCLGILNLFLAILKVITVSGFASLIITLFFSTGIIIFVIGVVGIYIGKIFESSKGRQLFIIEEEYKRDK